MGSVALLVRITGVSTVKKGKRWIAALLMVLLCLSLCGCQKLEDMRAKHAVWQEDGSILWDGNMYRPLTAFSEKTGLILEDGVIRVTEADVPVLLSDEFGEYCRVSRSGALLITRGHAGETLYCREDLYEFMAEHLKEPELTTYFYTYFNPDTNVYDYYYLSEQQGDTIDKLVLNLDFSAMEEEFYYTLEDNDFALTLGKCDDARWLSEDYAVQIARNDGVFYVIMPDGYIAEVPSRYDDDLKSIANVYFNAEVRPYLK